MRRRHRRRGTIENLCRHCRIARLDVFGSALRGDFGPGESDLDLLISNWNRLMGAIAHWR
ncbi:MAG: nucleotidyltransferase domain-containing protein [bacterium]|nr:nucleotidyltransferase domain-containing protein [bacterium]